MFDFIEQKKDQNLVSAEYIKNVEEKLNIKFPEVLKEYYLRYNGSFMKPCFFEMYGTTFEVLSICNLKIGSLMPAGKYFDSNAKRECLPRACYPLAESHDDFYFWNTQDDKIYCYRIDQENLVTICKGVEEFFEILNSCCDKKVVLPDFDNQEVLNPYESFITSDMFETKGEINAKKILKYYETFELKVDFGGGIFFMILGILLFIPPNGFFFINAIGCFVSAFIFFIMGFKNRQRVKKVLQKYDKNQLEKELKEASKLKDVEVYLTQNYIISNFRTMEITKYDEIVWIYINRNTREDILTAYLKNGRKIFVTLVKNPNQMYAIYGVICKKNNKVLIGQNVDNIKKYEQMNKNYKRKNRLELIFLLFLILFFIFRVILNIFMD